MRRMTWIWLAALTVGCVIGPSLLAAAVTSTGTPTLPQTDATEWGSSAVLAILTSWAMEWWKKSPFGGLSERTSYWGQRMIALTLAIAGGLGISFHFDAAQGTFTVAGLLLPSLAQAALHAARQFLFNEYVYRSGIKAPAGT